VSRQLQIPATLTPGKQPPILTRYKAMWVPDQSGHDGKQKNSFPCQDSNPSFPAHSQSLFCYFSPVLKCFLFFQGRRCKHFRHWKVRR